MTHRGMSYSPSYSAITQRSTARDPYIRPEVALVISSIQGRSLCTRHPIANGELGSGTPLSPEDLANLLASIAGDAMVWSSPDLIASGSQALVWSLKSAVRPLWMRIGNRPVNILVPWPRTVLRMSRKGLRVYAVPSDSLLEPDAPLFHAPLMNINAIGEMCFGSVERPPFGWAHRAEWEAALTATCFSHVNHPHTISSEHPVDTEAHVAFWRTLERAADFPDDRLVPAGLTLSDLVEGGRGV